MPETRKAIERRWRAFVGEYVKHFNAQRAYEDCGCYKARGTSARVHAFELLQKVTVQELIQEAIEARIERTEIDQDRVIYELARVGFFRLNSVVQWDNDDLTLKPSDQLTEDEAAALLEVGVEINEFESEHGVTRRIKRRIKAHNKLDALDKLARHVGLYEADNTRKIQFDDELEQVRDRLAKVLDQTDERLSHASTNGHRD